MIKVDDRTPEQVKSHRWLVVGTDSFLSGWGHAKGMTSYAGWAVDYGHLLAAESWVIARSDMKRVRIVLANTYRPKGDIHLHIYVWGEK